VVGVIKNRIERWIFLPHGPEAGTVELGQRRIFILPTRHGITFLLVLLLMLVGSINYNLSLGFVLTFLLAGMGITGMLHTWRNLVRIRVSPGRARPVFAGDLARFTVCLENPGDIPRQSLNLGRREDESVVLDLPTRQMVHATVTIPAPRRGLLRPGRLTLFTRFPLGLYRAWCYIQPDMHCMVYPRPAPPGAPLPPSEANSGRGARTAAGQDDFAGLRQYHPGDSPRHIAWKAAARDDNLLTKQFTSRGDTRLWLSWDHLPRALGAEEKLSQLARWILDAHTQGLTYGLRLPGTTVGMNSGDAHREHCLQSLAMFNIEGGGATVNAGASPSGGH